MIEQEFATTPIPRLFIRCTVPPNNLTGSGNTFGGDKRALQLRDSRGFAPHSHFIAPCEPQNLGTKVVQGERKTK